MMAHLEVVFVLEGIDNNAFAHVVYKIGLRRQDMLLLQPHIKDSFFGYSVHRTRNPFRSKIGTSDLSMKALS